MLTFRANGALRQALEIVAKQTKLTRSGVIRILLIQALRETIGYKEYKQKKSQKGVDSK